MEHKGDGRYDILWCCFKNHCLLMFASSWKLCKALLLLSVSWSFRKLPPNPNYWKELRDGKSPTWQQKSMIISWPTTLEIIWESISVVFCCISPRKDNKYVVLPSLGSYFGYLQSLPWPGGRFPIPSMWDPTGDFGSPTRGDNKSVENHTVEASVLPPSNFRPTGPHWFGCFQKIMVPQMDGL